MRKGLSWLQDYGGGSGYCVTFARGLDKAEMLRRFNADLSLAQMIRKDDWERLDKLECLGEIVQAGQNDEWAFVYEDNGYTGTLEDILRPVSAGTVAVSVFCNVNLVTLFSYAEDGVLLAQFDPCNPPFDDTQPQIQSLLRQAGITPERYSQGGDDFLETLFTLAQVTGVSLKRKALVGQPLLSTFLRNPVSDFLNELFTQGGHEQQTTDRLLTLLAHPHYRPRLLRLLEDWQQPECWQAVAERVDRALEVLHSVRATDVLLEVLKGEREAAIWGQEDESSRTMVVTEVLKALIRFDQMHDQQGARARLLSLIRAPEPEVVRHAALALGRLGDQRAVEPLVHVLAFSPHEREAIQLLGQMQAKGAIEPLVRLLDPQSEALDFQRAILEALVQIGEAHIAEQLVPLLHPETQWALFETLEQSRKAGPSVLQPAFGSLEDTAFSRRMTACAFQKELLASLGRLGNPRIVEALLNMLTPHTKFGYRGDFYLSLLDVLGKQGETRAIEPLARLLTHQIHLGEWDFQQKLVRVLRQLGDTRAELEAVEEALQQLDEDYHRRTGIWLSGERPAWLKQ